MPRELVYTLVHPIYVFHAVHGSGFREHVLSCRHTLGRFLLRLDYNTQRTHQDTDEHFRRTRGLDRGVNDLEDWLVRVRDLFGGHALAVRRHCLVVLGRKQRMDGLTGGVLFVCA